MRVFVFTMAVVTFAPWSQEVLEKGQRLAQQQEDEARAHPPTVWPLALCALHRAVAPRGFAVP